MAGITPAVRALVEVVEDAGVSKEHLFAVAVFDERRLDGQEAPVELADLDALYVAALHLTGNDALGLRMGELSSAAAFGLAGQLTARAASPREGVEALLRLHRILTNRQGLRLEEHHHVPVLVCEVPPGLEVSRRLRMEASVASFYRMLRHFLRGVRPRTVAFDYSAPTYRSKYSRMFEGLERFEQEFTGIVLEPEALAETAADSPKPISQPITEAPPSGTRRTRLARHGKYAERVKEYVFACAPDHRRNMTAVAQGLGMSVRSLRRRLGEEGVAYGDVIDSVLSAIAKRLIFEEGRPIEAAAYAMGYSDPAAFHRAFKRWTGTTPAAYRRMARAGAA